MHDKWDLLLIGMAAVGVLMMLANALFDASILQYAFVLTGIGGPGYLIRQAKRNPPT